MNRITWINIDGSEHAEILRGLPSLQQLQAFVGGYIERLFVKGGWMFVNEHGRFLGLLRNIKATRIWRQSEPLVRSPIVGPVVLVEELPSKMAMNRTNFMGSSFILAMVTCLLVSTVSAMLTTPKLIRHAGCFKESITIASLMLHAGDSGMPISVFRGTTVDNFDRPEWSEVAL